MAGAVFIDSLLMDWQHVCVLLKSGHPSIRQYFILHIRVSLVKYLIFVVCSFRKVHDNTGLQI